MGELDSVKSPAHELCIVVQGVARTVEMAAAKQFLRKALKRHGSQTNRQAVLSCDTTDQLQDQSGRQLKPIRIRQSQYLNNHIEQDHRAIKGASGR